MNHKTKPTPTANHARGISLPPGSCSRAEFFAPVELKTPQTPSISINKPQMRKKWPAVFFMDALTVADNSDARPHTWGSSYPLRGSRFKSALASESFLIVSLSASHSSLRPSL